ncbi:MAG: hypothetical protein E7082_07570 [Bacteroidales bacterium]|nr:hypothetical protein [Bacteroidales bacterium]
MSKNGLFKSLWNHLRSAALAIWIGINTFVASVTVFSAYAGHIDQEYVPLAGIVGMTFPLWYVLCVVLLIVNLIKWNWKWVTIAPAMALIIAFKGWLTFWPINFGNNEVLPDEESRAFKVLSYNIVSFVDEEKKSTRTFNRTMHYILHSDADIVALFEYENQGKLSKFVPQTQIDSLNRLYPYFAKGGLGTVMYSKRPILHIIPPKNIHSRGSMEAFRTNVCDRPITVFAVHLESIGLDDKDKKLYRDLTDDDKDISYSQVRTQLIDKLYYAFRNRSKQAKMLRSYVEQLGGDAVVCGDFNDVPGCRTIRILEEAGLRDAYYEVGNGACRTFNAPRFPFRIDHVLWRGDFEARNIERGDVASSDHFPMLTTFVWSD